MKMWKKDPTISTDMLREYDEGDVFCWFLIFYLLYKNI